MDEYIIKLHLGDERLPIELLIYGDELVMIHIFYLMMIVVILVMMMLIGYHDICWNKLIKK